MFFLNKAPLKKSQAWSSLKVFLKKGQKQAEHLKENNKVFVEKGNPMFGKDTFFCWLDANQERKTKQN